MKFTVKTTGNWAEVEEFETLKEALQEFEMVAQGNFHYYIAKGVEEPYEVTLRGGETFLCSLTPNSFKGSDFGSRNEELVEFTEYDEDFSEPSARGKVLIHHFNADGKNCIGGCNYDVYTVRYDC